MMDATPKPRRRRLRLTLGGLMVVVMLFGGWLGWIVHRARVQREAVAAILKAGGNIVYDWQWGNEDAKPPGPKWLRELIGPDYFETVEGINANKPAFDDAVVAHIGRLTRVKFLGLQGSTVSDAGLAKLAGMTELRTFHLRSANVNGSGFRHFAGLRNLHALQLGQAPIADANLAHLERLPALEKLGFHKTGTTDAGMKAVAKLEHLKVVWLSEIDVGDDGLRELGRSGRPLVVIVRRKTRITPEGIAAMKTLAPHLHVTR